MNEKSKQIIWEENTFSNFNIFRIGVILFMLFSSVLLIFWDILDLDVRLGLVSIFIFMITLTLLIYFLFTKMFYKIQFYNSTLIIKQGNLGMPRKFEISKIMKLDISIIKRPIWYKVGKKISWTSKISLILKVVDLNYTENVFIFKSIKSQLLSTKQVENKEDALNIPHKFEKKLGELEKLFPNLVDIHFETKDQPGHKIIWINILFLCIFTPILIFMLSFMYEINPRRLISIGFGMLTLLFSVLVIYIYHRSRKSEIKMINDFSYNKTLILNSDYISFKRLIIVDPSNLYEGTKLNELKINSPEMCPFCGSYEISDTLKLKSIYESPYKFIRIAVCKEHEKLEEKITWKYYIFLLMVTLPVIISFPIGLYLKNYILIMIGFFITVGILIIYLFINLIEIKHRNSYIRKNIFFESFYEGSVISVKIPKWAEIFKKHNVCYDVKEDDIQKLNHLDALWLRLRKRLTIFLVLSIILLFGLIPALVLSSFFKDPFRQIFIGIYQIIFIFFIVICGYIYLYLINTEMQRKRSELYFKNSPSSSQVPINNLQSSRDLPKNNTLNSFIFCTFCGAKIKFKDKFCTSCGKNLDL